MRSAMQPAPYRFFFSLFIGHKGTIFFDKYVTSPMFFVHYDVKISVLVGSRNGSLITLR